MPRGVAAAIASLLLTVSLHAGELWKNLPGQETVKSTQPVQVSADRPIWEEYGFTTAESAEFGRYKATAYQFKDSTEAFAASLWLAPTQPSATASANYVITCEGTCPKISKILQSVAQLPKWADAPLPILHSYLPDSGQIQKSERYVLGPAGLAQMAPQIPSSLIQWQYSPEADLTRYPTPHGEQTLVIVNYPTPQMAREQSGAIEKAGIGLVKRSGPLLAIVPMPPDLAAGQKLLEQINYQAQVEEHEQVPIPVKAQTVAQMVLAIISLAGIVLVFCAVSGFAYGAYRVLRVRFGGPNAEDSLIVLHLLDK